MSHQELKPLPTPTNEAADLVALGVNCMIRNAGEDWVPAVKRSDGRFTMATGHRARQPDECRDMTAAEISAEMKAGKRYLAGNIVIGLAS